MARVKVIAKAKSKAKKPVVKKAVDNPVMDRIASGLDDIKDAQISEIKKAGLVTTRLEALKLALQYFDDNKGSSEPSEILEVAGRFSDFLETGTLGIV